MDDRATEESEGPADPYAEDPGRPFDPWFEKFAAEMAKPGSPGMNPAGGMPEAAQAYLATVALRRRTEPKDMAVLRAEHPEGTIWHQTPKVRRPVSAEQLWEGRKWLDDNSAPLTAVTKDALIDLRDAHYPQGSNTASRGWSIWRGVLKFAAGEGMISRELYVFVGEEQPRVEVRPPVADEQIPTVAEMWHFSEPPDGRFSASCQLRRRVPAWPVMTVWR